MTIDTPLPATMKAIMARGKYNLQLEDVPVPQIEHPTDVILKTRVSGLCGAYLPVFPS